METTKLNESIWHQLYAQQTGNEPINIEKLPRSGSDRQYARLTNETGETLLAAFNPNVDENEAYFAFSEHFSRFNINVPKVLAIGSDRQHYLVEDIGRDSLYDHITLAKGEFNNQLNQLYCKALTDLVQMQVVAGKTIDYTKCFPTDKFDQTAIGWDLNYFKYCYLKLAHVDFDEVKLEQDFDAIKQAIANIDCSAFMFRDFQSRNILLKNNTPYYIDFQGGRRGPLTYDVASLLYQAKAQLSEDVRNKLFDHYATELSKVKAIDKAKLFGEFKLFALLRTLQVLGAYGYRGYFEQKTHFISSIPFAIENLKTLLQQNLPIDLPYIKHIANQLNTSKTISTKADRLTVKVFSFSYKRGIPFDESGNGGGFVFDCRGQHNPGRFPEYKNVTGRDQMVKDFFKQNPGIDQFLDDATRTVSPTIETYMRRGFASLMVSFGCTGGQHRSVYCAQGFAERISKLFDIDVELCHREQNITEKFSR